MDASFVTVGIVSNMLKSYENDSFYSGLYEDK